jgi:hypothetical protein
MMKLLELSWKMLHGMPNIHHPKFKKKFLHIFATKVQDVIHKEIGDAKFCILVDEARNE